MLFRLADEVMKVKMKVDDTWDGHEAVVISEDHDEACFFRLGERIPFYNIQNIVVSIGAHNDQLDLSAIDHGHSRYYPGKAKGLFYKNKVKVAKTATFATQLFCKLYSQLAKLTNVTRDNFHVDPKLFAMTDFN